ncbi:MAG: hypothetical protein K0S47_2200 [Herbinix sp.]|nr:hypothetical protein [Herbinix sp.]
MISIIKRKYINWSHNNWIDSYSYKIIRVEDFYKGYLSFIKIDKVKYKLIANYEDSTVCLVDNGYKCLVLLPDHEKWCLSVIYNLSDEIVEWYFDITKQNSIDEEGNPFYDDLFLDIAISPDFNIKILDEDELTEALHENIISDHDYQMAYEICNKIINEIIPNKDFLVDYFRGHLKSFCK